MKFPSATIHAARRSHADLLDCVCRLLPEMARLPWLRRRRLARLLRSVQLLEGELVWLDTLRPCAVRSEREPGHPVEVSAQMRPRIVCLCGSTRFSEAFQAANLSETLEGNIVLSIGCDMRSDAALGLPADTKAKLDDLHLRKIDLADEVLILNVGGYMGESTKREFAYARERGKTVRFLEPQPEGEGDGR